MKGPLLITGAQGFVGSHLRAALAAKGLSDVVGLAAPGQAPPAATGETVVADLRDHDGIDALVARLRPSAVVHLAAQASVARGAREGGLTFATNLGGSLNLALAMARHAPAATLLFASSSEVYGASFLRGAVDETAVPLPLNDYARSKWLAEQALAAVLPETASLIVARPFNHTGPGQSEDFALPSFAGQIARIETGQAARLVVGNLDVSRDFLDARDVADAYVALLTAPRLPRRFVCNIASGAARPLRQHLETLLGLTNVKVEVAVDPARLRKADIPVALGQAASLAAFTGWTPRRPMETTLRDLLDHARGVASGH